jgi:hypothetical protein
MGGNRFSEKIMLQRLAQRHTAVADALIKLLGDALDALGRGAERSSNRGLGRLVAIGRQHAGILKRGKFFFQALHPMPCFGQFVGHRKRRHHREPRIADLTEFAAKPADPRIEIAREFDEMTLLAILASHPELPTVDGDVDLSHFARVSRSVGRSVTSKICYAKDLRQDHSSAANTPRIVSIA